MVTHRARVEAILAGDRADRLPVAFWRHWPGDDQDAERLAEVTLAFHRRYDWDLAKVTPSSSYAVEDWGGRTHYVGIPLGEREYLERVVTRPADWAKIRPLDVTQGAYGRQLATLRSLRAVLGPDVPLLMTVFNPLTVVRFLAGDDRALAHPRLYPRETGAALDAIAETLTRFVAAAVEAGADGVFYSTMAAAASVLGEAEYRERCLPLDRRILEAADGGWLNVLHLHSAFPYLALARELPVQAVNWDDRLSEPPLAEGRQVAGRAVFGGINQWVTLQQGSPEDVRAEARDAIQQAGGRGMLLSAGCTFPLTVPEGNLLAARHVVEESASTGGR